MCYQARSHETRRRQTERCGYRRQGCCFESHPRSGWWTSRRLPKNRCWSRPQVSTGGPLAHPRGPGLLVLPHSDRRLRLERRQNSPCNAEMDSAGSRQGHIRSRTGILRRRHRPRTAEQRTVGSTPSALRWTNPTSTPPSHQMVCRFSLVRRCSAGRAHGRRHGRRIGHRRLPCGSPRFPRVRLTTRSVEQSGHMVAQFDVVAGTTVMELPEVVSVEPSSIVTSATRSVCPGVTPVRMDLWGAAPGVTVTIPGTLAITLVEATCEKQKVACWSNGVNTRASAETECPTAMAPPRAETDSDHGPWHHWRPAE